LVGDRRQVGARPVGRWSADLSAHLAAVVWSRLNFDLVLVVPVYLSCVLLGGVACRVCAKAPKIQGGGLWRGSSVSGSVCCADRSKPHRTTID